MQRKGNDSNDSIKRRNFLRAVGVGASATALVSPAIATAATKNEEFEHTYEDIGGQTVKWVEPTGTDDAQTDSIDDPDYIDFGTNVREYTGTDDINSTTEWHTGLTISRSLGLKSIGTLSEDGGIIFQFVLSGFGLCTKIVMEEDDEIGEREVEGLDFFKSDHEMGIKSEDFNLSATAVPPAYTRFGAFDEGDLDLYPDLGVPITDGWNTGLSDLEEAQTDLDDESGGGIVSDRTAALQKAALITGLIGAALTGGAAGVITKITGAGLGLGAFFSGLAGTEDDSTANPDEISYSMKETGSTGGRSTRAGWVHGIRFYVVVPENTSGWLNIYSHTFGGAPSAAADIHPDHATFLEAHQDGDSWSVFINEYDDYKDARQNPPVISDIPVDNPPCDPGDPCPEKEKEKHDL